MNSRALSRKPAMLFVWQESRTNDDDTWCSMMETKLYDRCRKNIKKMLKNYYLQHVYNKTQQLS